MFNLPFIYPFVWFPNELDEGLSLIWWKLNGGTDSYCRFLFLWSDGFLPWLRGDTVKSHNNFQKAIDSAYKNRYIIVCKVLIITF